MLSQQPRECSRIGACLFLRDRREIGVASLLAGVCSLALVLAWSAAWRQNTVHAAEEAGYGSVTGQVVFDGELAPQMPVIKAGDSSIKDAAVCGAADIPSDELVIDPETKGIAHVFVYLPKAREIHPKLKSSAEKEVVFDQKGCRFIPHALLARTDQIVRVKSGDGCAHNTHTDPVRAQGVNLLIPPNERKGIEVVNRTPENLPTRVKCDIHPWMKAYWLVLDHPYAAVTDAQGRFKIADLPAGEYEFKVWQEKCGYVHKSLKVTIKPGETVDLGKVLAPAAKFQGR